MSKETTWDDLATVNKAGWNASWGANHGEEVKAAHQRLVTFIKRTEALEVTNTALRKQIARQVAIVADERQRRDDMREIVAAVAAIRETRRGDPAEPYDAQISLLIVTKARALLAKKKEGT